MYKKRSHASFDDIPMISNPTINLANKAKKILRAKQVAKVNVELESRAAEQMDSTETPGSIPWIN
jgi:hypothetical protein